MRLWQIALFLAVAAVVAAGGVRLYTDYTLDDSFIGYRYAENLAAGKGFVYNEGERELGTTTPLYILLLALLDLVGLPVPATSTAIGIASFAGTVVLAWSLARRFGAGETISFLGALSLCVWPPALRTAISGMETSAYAMLVLLVIHLYADRRMRAFVVAGAALFLLRPDGAFLLATIGLFDLLVRGGRVRDWALRAGLVVLLCLPWLVFSGLYFGMLLPNSGFAKMLQMEDWGHFSKLLEEQRVAIGALLPLVGLGFLHAIRRDGLAALPGLYVLVHYAAFSAMSFPACPWYLGPVQAPILIMATLGAGMLLRRFADSRRFVWTLLALLALHQFGPTYGAIRKLSRRQARVDSHHAAVGRWLAENAPPGANTACDNIGYIGYLGRGRILDVTGLIQNEVLEGIRRTGDRTYALRTHVPEYIAMQTRGASPKYMPPEEWFEENGYVLRFRVPYRKPGQAYCVWQRRTER